MEKFNFKQFGNVVIDIETLSTRTNASILEIAAVEFNLLTGETGAEFNVRIRPDEWGKNGRHLSGDTVSWWMNQSEEARQHLFKKDSSECMTLGEALTRLSEFIRQCDVRPEGRTLGIRHEGVCVWGNGSIFDITILQSAYEHFGFRTPWHNFNVRDIRTITALNHIVKDTLMESFRGIPHTALADCHHEVRYLSETLKTIKVVSMSQVE